METQALDAENLKNLGNEEFKNNNFLKAIEYYTQAIGKNNSS